MANTGVDEKALREHKNKMGYLVLNNIFLNMLLNLAIISV